MTMKQKVPSKKKKNNIMFSLGLPTAANYKYLLEQVGLFKKGKNLNKPLAILGLDPLSKWSKDHPVCKKCSSQSTPHLCLTKNIKFCNITLLQPTSVAIPFVSIIAGKYPQAVLIDGCSMGRSCRRKST